MTRVVRSALVPVSLVIALCVSIVPADATTFIGSPCSKISNLIKSGNKVLVCARIGAKLTWKVASHSQAAKYVASQKAILQAAADKAAADKAAADKAAADKAAADCVAGVVCSVGQTGPGGGIVFYDPGSTQPWGRYLEVAPSNWSGGSDPVSVWCSTQPGLLTRVSQLGFEIGDGPHNTNLMLSWCVNGAAEIARAYNGGGKTDWFLPSRKELDQLCIYAHYQTTQSASGGCLYGQMRSGFSSNYWSSTNADSITAYFASFSTGGVWDNWWWDSVKAQYGSNLGNDVAVRPIRAF